MATDGPMLLTALTLVALSVAVFTSHRPFKVPRATVFLAAALTLVALSTAFSEFWPFALFGSPRIRLGVISLVPLGALAVLAAPFAPEIRSILRQIAPWACAAWVLTVLGQVIAGLPIAWGLSSNGALSAQFLVLLLPVLLSTVRAAHVRLLVGCGVAGVLWYIGSALGVVLALVWSALHAGLSRDRIERMLWRAAPVLPVTHALISAAGVAAVLGSGTAAAGYLGTRPQFWRSALDVAREWWVIGAGPDSFPHVAARLITPASAYIEGDTPALSVSAHNLWLDIGVHGGIAGVVLALVAATALARTWSRARDPGTLPFIAGVLLFFTSTLLQPVSLQSLPALVMMLVATLPARSGGVAIAHATQRRGLSWVARRAPGIAGLACATPLLFFALTCLAVGRPDYHPASAAFTETAARAWRYDPELWAQSAYRHGLEIEEPPGREARTRYLEAGLTRAIELVPSEHRYLLERAHASDALGMEPAVVAVRYDAALGAFPLSPEVNFSRGLFLARQGDLAGARSSYAVLESLYPEWSGTRNFEEQARGFGLDLAR